LWGTYIVKMRFTRGGPTYNKLLHIPSGYINLYKKDVVGGPLWFSPWQKISMIQMLSKTCFPGQVFLLWWKTLNHEKKIKTEGELVFMVEDIKSWKRIKTESCQGYHEVTQIYHDVVGVPISFSPWQQNSWSNYTHNRVKIMYIP
jgi:hypothetical protein